MYSIYVNYGFYRKWGGLVSVLAINLGLSNYLMS